VEDEEKGAGRHPCSGAMQSAFAQGGAPVFVNRACAAKLGWAAWHLWSLTVPARAFSRARMRTNTQVCTHKRGRSCTCSQTGWFLCLRLRCRRTPLTPVATQMHIHTPHCQTHIAPPPPSPTTPIHTPRGAHTFTTRRARTSTTLGGPSPHTEDVYETYRAAHRCTHAPAIMVSLRMFMSMRSHSPGGKPRNTYCSWSTVVSSSELGSSPRQH